MRNILLETGLLLAVMAAAAGALWPSVKNDFVWDDAIYVSGNPLIRDLSPGGIKRIFAGTHYGLYKPASIVTLALNYRYCGLDPAPYRITNIALHAANAGLAFALILLLTQNTAAAFICALLFGVHPLRVESVAWVSERKDVLYALFFLLSSVFYAAYVKNRSRIRYIAALVCFGVSLTAKPMGITLPAVLFVYDYLLGRQFDKRLLPEKLPYILVAGAFGLWTYFLLGSANQFKSGYSLSDRIFFVFYGLKFYAVKLFYPVRLSAIYPFPARNGGALPLDYLLSPALVLGVLLLAVKRFHREKPLMAGLAFYIIAVAPALQFFPSGQAVTADRYSYIPSLGLFLPVAVYAERLLRNLRARNIKFAVIAAACMAALAATLFFAARARCRVWHDNLALFSDAACKYPDISTSK
ncbi:MAG: hypothetical protein PHW69_06815, partial [Elusimicrobiaceae bacterium]|nr:hypothetical protein [Elusimicrobiaceae bacterium]